MGKATAKPRDSSRENRIGPREKFSSRTGQLADPYLGASRLKIQDRRQTVHHPVFPSSQFVGGGDDRAIVGGDAAVG